MTTILHVEDDELLAEAVASTFEAFGFPGRFLTASSFKKAQSIITDVQEELDLILSDMELLDGTGLDVVQLVRSTPVREHLPVLILSGRADPSTVNRAYALGANVYTTKSARGRNPDEVLRAIYEHWLKDARLPAAGSGRTHRVIARATSIRSRLAQRYMTIAERLGSNHGDFWIAIAEREGNLANLLVFLLGQLGNRELPVDVLDDLDAHQRELLRVMDEPAGVSSFTEDDAFADLLALSAPTDAPAFTRALGLLFPAAPVAMGALLDAQASSFEMTAWEIENDSKDPDLRNEAEQLKRRATLLRTPHSNGDAESQSSIDLTSEREARV
jgi:CheY-like chemotaxis protein